MKVGLKQIKLPSVAIKLCPACKSGAALRVRALDVVCGCGWDSGEAFVDCGGMDLLIAAYERLEQEQQRAERRRSRRCGQRLPVAHAV